ncbi:hypothetical protein BAE44_0024441 [Dichanthelium oligosanthes]|uniref:F-box domain-containing protein n=1 Tax=Dichanthelium oligosanthes TaxID=888268 RepID=A0A1E5UNS7_9POAL|nr:hypothetical protein BAE44_0024441 [Dichanthelium oligosanthes]
METDTKLSALTDDVLAAILCRVPAPSLAASRSVCKAWRGLIDDPRLLLLHVLPCSVRGLFINYLDHDMPHLFARPTSSVPRRLSFAIVCTKLFYSGYRVTDHCNGLVLHSRDDVNGYARYVCNPATRWWARLPPCSGYGRTFLVFDPALSPHYEVLWTERDPENPKDNRRKKKLGQDAEAETPEEEEGEYNSWRLTEWSPSRWTWHGFSSRTSQWEERVFVRECEAAGTLGYLLLHQMRYIPEPRWRYAAYWQGALYVHCQGEYVSR